VADEGGSSLPAGLLACSLCLSAGVACVAAALRLRACVASQSRRSAATGSWGAQRQSCAHANLCPPCSCLLCAAQHDPPTPAFSLSLKALDPQLLSTVAGPVLPAMCRPRCRPALPSLTADAAPGASPAAASGRQGGCVGAMHGPPRSRGEHLMPDARTGMAMPSVQPQPSS